MEEKLFYEEQLKRYHSKIRTAPYKSPYNYAIKIFTEKLLKCKDV